MIPLQAAAAAIGAQCDAAIEVTAVDSGDPAGSLVTSIPLSILENEFPWHNAANPVDTTRDGKVTPLDALVGINLLNEIGNPLLIGGRKLPTSRPRTLHCTVIRRRPHSRVIVEGPSTTSIVAKRLSGIRSPPGPATTRAPMASGLLRKFSGRRTTRGKRSCPSTTSPRDLLPMASIKSKTARAWTP